MGTGQGPHWVIEQRAEGQHWAVEIKNTLFDIFFAVKDQPECVQDKKMQMMNIKMYILIPKSADPLAPAGGRESILRARDKKHILYFLAYFARVILIQKIF